MAQQLRVLLGFTNAPDHQLEEIAGSVNDNMTGNAACVIAERNAILNGIPKSLWGPAYERAFALVAGTTQTLGEKIARAEKHLMLADSADS